MKWQGRRQSKNVEVQTPKQRKKAEAGFALRQKTLMMKDRALSPEPIASNEYKTPTERHPARNPGKTLKAKDRPIDTNPSDFQHFKHTTKGK